MADEQQVSKPSTGNEKRRKTRKRRSSVPYSKPAPAKKHGGPFGWVKANPKPSAAVAVVALVLVLVFARPDADSEPLEENATDDIFADLDALKTSEQGSADSAEPQSEDPVAQPGIGNFEVDQLDQEVPPFDQTADVATYNPGESVTGPAWATTPQSAVEQPQLTLPGSLAHNQTHGSQLTPIRPIGFSQADQAPAVWLTGTIELEDSMPPDESHPSRFTDAQPLLTPPISAPFNADSSGQGTYQTAERFSDSLPIVTPGSPSNQRQPAGLPIINPGRSRATENRFPPTNNNEPATATARY